MALAFPLALVITQTIGDMQADSCCCSCTMQRLGYALQLPKQTSFCAVCNLCKDQDV